ncbi:MAG TPA: ATP-binding cassette domain-containing protein, partial [Spirochaetota bacterium]|nr:ATP-binding cassette domain-containing protein [Spirochaetota bacterium]
MITVQGITKRFGDITAVNNISFTIKEGEITGLLGPNGAGKTTTLRMLTGYLKPDSGTITIGDFSVNDDSVDVRRIVGYLPESAPVYGDMLVYDYLSFIAEVRGIADEKRIEEIGALCGINDVMHQGIGELSKGYRQRVGLAQSMIHDPEILILDEPTSGLDPNQIIEIRNLIREIGKKKTIILSTHILPEVEATCDRVIIIDR